MQRLMGGRDREVIGINHVMADLARGVGMEIMIEIVGIVSEVVVVDHHALGYFSLGKHQLFGYNMRILVSFRS